MKRVIRQLRHGQITIPKDLRRAAGIEPDDMLSVDVVDGRLQIEAVRVTPKLSANEWLKDLYDLFAPVRESLKDVPEDEINREIDEAIAEVRSRNR